MQYITGKQLIEAYLQGKIAEKGLFVEVVRTAGQSLMEQGVQRKDLTHIRFTEKVVTGKQCVGYQGNTSTETVAELKQKHINGSAVSLDLIAQMVACKECTPTDVHEAVAPFKNTKNIYKSKGLFAHTYNDGVTDLFFDAAGGNYVDIVQFILKNNMVDKDVCQYFDSFNCGTVMHRAALNKSREAYNLLKSFGCDETICDDCGLSGKYRYEECFMTRSLEQVDVLSHFINVHPEYNLAKDFQKWMTEVLPHRTFIKQHTYAGLFNYKNNFNDILVSAIEQNCNNVVKFLLDNHIADKNARVFSYRSPTQLSVWLKEPTISHIAVANNNVEALYCLLSVGADMNAHDDEGNTPKDLAVKTSQKDREFMRQNSHCFRSHDADEINFDLYKMTEFGMLTEMDAFFMTMDIKKSAHKVTSSTKGQLKRIEPVKTR